MATVSRRLPQRPHLDVPKREARELLDQWREGRPDAFERIRRAHPRFNDPGASALAIAAVKLSDAQLVLAREYGFANWAALKKRIVAASAAAALQTAIEDSDRDAVVALLRANPEMLHLPVWSGNWGPPMSHAANLGRLEIIQAVAELGARDYQHAFERAVLQGQLEGARWLHARGARLEPGIVMGACETLNATGFDFLLELGAPLVGEQGNRLAPLAMVLETYGRNPAGKHAILRRFGERGYELPDTPMMAFHRGDLVRMRRFFQEDPLLAGRRFLLPEIYPAECGCAEGGRLGLHWTPINGTTLLHLAVDFRERELFEWLLAETADVEARALVDREGFGGHTALFNAVVAGPWKDATFAAALIGRGASGETRVNLRKFLDWCEQPRWHEARNVTPAEWARTFPDRGWINSAALEVLEA
jgi:hypothetical protein